jgi:hypothetical protein
MEILFKTAGYVWRLTAVMAPSLLFGFFIAGILSMLVTPEMVYRHLGRSSLWQICKASLFGVPLPLCSCSVLPVAASLRKNGAGRGSTISFLTSTPQTGVDSIFITYSMLGPVFALIRCVAAFLSGIICGSVVELFVKDDPPLNPQEKNLADEGCHCNGSAGGRASLSAKFSGAMRYAFVSLPGDIGRSMFFGLLLSGILAAFLPENYFVDKFVGNELVSMLVLLVFGLVVYVCSSGSVPIVIALIAAGISPGAGLVFLIVGPATNMAALVTVFKILGNKASTIYLVVLSVTALFSGYLLNLFVDSSYVTQIVHGEHNQLGFVNHICAVVLLGLLAPALRPNRKK